MVLVEARPIASVVPWLIVIDTVVEGQRRLFCGDGRISDPKIRRTLQQR